MFLFCLLHRSMSMQVRGLQIHLLCDALTVWSALPIHRRLPTVAPGIVRPQVSGWHSPHLFKLEGSPGGPRQATTVISTCVPAGYGMAILWYQEDKEITVQESRCEMGYSGSFISGSRSSIGRMVSVCGSTSSEMGTGVSAIGAGVGAWLAVTSSF